MSRNSDTHAFLLLGLAMLVFIVGLICEGCNNSAGEISLDEKDPIIEKFITESNINKLDEEAGTVLYCDASAVLIDAMTNSDIYKAMRSQMNQYIETLVFINGTKFDTIQCDKSEQKIHDALDEASKKAGNANIQTAIENICKDNRQGMLITDFEFVKMEGKTITKCYDTDPYLTSAFITWLSKGFQIRFLIEPYYEGTDLKKRFYVFFTDPNAAAPISNTMLQQVQSYMVKSNPQIRHCCLFSLNTADYGIISEGANSCSDEIDMVTLKSSHPKVAQYSISDSWDDIKENVMKLDDKDEFFEGETSIPLIDNLKIVQGQNYTIKNIKVRATNISKSYLINKGEEQFDNPNEQFDISDAFDLKITSDNQIKVFLKKEIFNDEHLYSKEDGFSGNLIRLEFYVSTYEVNEYDSSVFEWTSCRTPTKGQTANCVSLSIANALNDINVVPISDKHKLLYTIFIQTESK